MASLLSWYSAQLVSYPVTTKSLTSALLMSGGDAIQQYLEYKTQTSSVHSANSSSVSSGNSASSSSSSTSPRGNKVLSPSSSSDVFPSLPQSQSFYPFLSSLLTRLRYRLLPAFLIYFQFQRCLRMFLYGLLVVGPAVHYWFLLLSQIFAGESFFYVLAKVLADQLFFAPIVNSVFFPFIGVLEGKGCGEIYRRWRVGFPQVMILNYRIFPLAQLINFGLIPLEYQVLFINIIALIFNIFVSRIVNHPAATPPITRKANNANQRKKKENGATEEVEIEGLLTANQHVEMQSMHQDV